MGIAWGEHLRNMGGASLRRKSYSQQKIPQGQLNAPRCPGCQAGTALGNTFKAPAKKDSRGWMHDCLAVSGSATISLGIRRSRLYAARSWNACVRQNEYIHERLRRPLEPIQCTWLLLLPSITSFGSSSPSLLLRSLFLEFCPNRHLSKESELNAAVYCAFTAVGSMTFFLCFLKYL